MIAPATLQELKATLLGVLFILLMPSLPRWRMSFAVLSISCVALLVSFWGAALGIASNNLGAMSNLGVFILWPVMYLFVLGFVGSFNANNVLLKVFRLTAFYLTLKYSLILVMGYIGLETTVKAIFSYDDVAANFFGGFVEFRSDSLTSVAYLYSFFAARVIACYITGKETRLDLLFAIATAVALVFSGRRAFWLLLFFAPAFAAMLSWLWFRPWRTKRSPVLSMGVAVTLAVAIFTVSFSSFIDVSAVISQISMAFSSEEQSGAQRLEQAAALWASIQEKPFFGWGIGGVSTVVRSQEMPWAYELSYMSLAMNVGLVGVTIYLLANLTVIALLVRLSRLGNGQMVVVHPAITGMICFLLLNVTNPYLMKFAYLWVLFYPACLLNIALLQRHSLR